MTWTIEMSNKELARKTEVERVIDHRITQKEAANKLGVTERQFRRILQRYRQEGDGGLVSRKRGKPSNRRTDAEIRDTARKFIEAPIMKGFGPTLMAEKLEKKKGICLSKETLRRMMIEADVWKAKTKKIEEPHYSRPRRKSRRRAGAD
ncbi:MAG: helix-turn-helix domain-containing protein [Anaerolineaceae bacterium]